MTALATITPMMNIWKRFESAIRAQVRAITGGILPCDGAARGHALIVLKRTKFPCVRPTTGLRSRQLP